MEPISTNLSSTVNLSQPSTAQSAAGTQEASPVVKAGKGDTIELTITAQIMDLQRQGRNVREIAQQLGMDPRTVQFLLGENT